MGKNTDDAMTSLMSDGVVDGGQSCYHAHSEMEIGWTGESVGASQALQIEEKTE